MVQDGAVSKLTIAVCLGLAACSSTAGDGTSGISGIVLVGPQCPVQVQGQECPDEPLAAELRIVARASGAEVARVTSGEDGRFTVDLAPGEYTIEPLSPPDAPLPAGTPIDVVVRAGEFSEVTVSYDSGIR